MPAISATGDRATRSMRQRRSSGFTLMELLVAVTIMVLVAASLPIALSRLLPSRRVAVTADRLVTDLQWLQGESIRLRTPGLLTLLDDGYRMEVGQITRSARLASTTNITFRARADERQMTRMRVFPDGSAQPGRFQLVDSGRAVELQIGMLTGRLSRVR